MYFWSCSLFTIFSRMQGNKIIFTIFHRQYYIITKTLVTAFKDQPCFLGTFLYKLTSIYVFENPKQNVDFWVYETLKIFHNLKRMKVPPAYIQFFSLKLVTMFGFEQSKNLLFLLFTQISCSFSSPLTTKTKFPSNVW